MDPIFAIRNMEKYYEYNVTLHQLFSIDFKHAYDSLERINIHIIMLEFGIPKKLVRPVQMTLK